MFDHKLKTQEGHSEIVDCTGKLHDEQNTKKIETILKTYLQFYIQFPPFPYYKYLYKKQILKLVLKHFS